MFRIVVWSEPGVRLVVLAALAGSLAACTAVLGGGEGDSAENGGDGAPGVLSASTSELRRLGRSELENTLHDLFPALSSDFEATSDLPSDNEIQMAFSLPGSVSELEVKRFMELAEETMVELGASSDPSRLAPEAACETSDETACARDFVERFGKRAFRRPLDPVEIDDLLGLYRKLRTDPEMAYDRPGALTVLAEAILQSPGFLYRLERGHGAPERDGDLLRYDDFEIASRLAYFLWNSMPDAELSNAAERGELSSPDGIATQAERLLDDPRADRMIEDFVFQWLELGPLLSLTKDADTYPSFDADVARSMYEETRRFSLDVFRGPEADFATLLTADYTFADSLLAAYYGVAADETGRVDLSGGPRRGILTQGALLAVKGNSYRTSPVRRGKLLVNRLLCVKIPPPPPDVIPDLPLPDPNLTQREQMAAHREDPACATCHVTMDSLGFAFEHFDGAGAYREREGTRSIDASGEVDLDGEMRSFSDASELIDALADSSDVHGCFARQWVRYALDRFERSNDEVAVERVAAEFEESGSSFRSLILAIVRSKPFTHRLPNPGEVLE